MNTQTDALRRADHLRSIGFLSGIEAELRALVAANAELLADMKLIAETSHVEAVLDPQRAVRVARAAIAKHQG